MTATLISLFSISLGIIGANISGFIYKKYSFGLIGNTIAGVFGSIFILKSFGRLGFDPNSIIAYDNVHLGLFALNILISFFSGAVAIFLISKLKQIFNTIEKSEFNCNR